MLSITKVHRVSGQTTSAHEEEPGGYCNNMSLDENTVDRPHEERSQAGETDTTDSRRTHRLYPSLPTIDSVFRYEARAPDCSIEEKLHTAAAHHADSLLETEIMLQSEAPAASSDVRLRAQILILEEQRQELLSINERWAKEYQTMKQYYKKKVLSMNEKWEKEYQTMRQYFKMKIQDLTASLTLERGHFEEETDEEGEKSIVLFTKANDEESTWAGDGDVRSALLKAEKEANELRAHNSTLTRRGQQQHEEIRRLNKALEKALKTTQPLDVSSETTQDIWKHQAKVYKEDFLQERKDREKLKAKYLELKEKFVKLQSELHVVKPQVPRTRPPQPVLECTCANRAKHSDWEVLPNGQHGMQMQRR